MDYDVAYLSCPNAPFFQGDTGNPLFCLNINVAHYHIKSALAAMT
ncbi:hypothetical protein [Pectobacterium sp. B1J-3]